MRFYVRDWWNNWMIYFGFKVCHMCEGAGMVRANFIRDGKHVIHKECCSYCPDGRKKRRKMEKNND